MDFAVSAWMMEVLESFKSIVLKVADSCRMRNETFGWSLRLISRTLVTSNVEEVGLSSVKVLTTFNVLFTSVLKSWISLTVHE